MKKKLLSIFLSLSLIFSSIASISVAFAEEPELEKISTEKVVQQDGIEVRMDMKAGSKIKICTSLNGGNADPENVGEYFDGKEVPYDGWQLMKIDINIPQKDGLKVNSITPSVESLQPNYSKLSEKDDKYNYSFYFKNNGVYNFDVEYVLNNIQKNIKLEYSVDNLIEIPDVTMRGYFLVALDPNGYHGYLTKDDIENGRLYQSKETFKRYPLNIGSFGGPDGFFECVKNINGVEYMKNMKTLDFWGSPYYFHKQQFSLESLEPFTQGYYPNLETFEFSEIDTPQTRVKRDAYTPDTIGRMLEKMPNLSYFYANNNLNSLTNPDQKVIFNNFEYFRKMEGKKLKLISCPKNKIKKLNGVEEHKNLKNIYLNVNEISDLTPLSNYTEANTWNFIQNEIFDLRPIQNLKKINNVIHFGFQSIYLDPVLVKLNNDNYELEVPMPIDIDGSYTKVGFADFLDNSNISSQVPNKERNQLLVKYPDGNKKVYPITEKDGKAYIKIPKADVPNAGTDKAFEDVKMRLWFENDNGKDNRTRGLFNGRVEFGATTQKKPIEKKYKVSYEFENAKKSPANEGLDLNNMQLPEEVIKLLPKDETEYPLNKTGVEAKKVEKTVFSKYVDDNIDTYLKWEFDGYYVDGKKSDKLTIKDGENKFVGKWICKDVDLARYKFVSDDKNNELPDEIKGIVPGTEAHIDIETNDKIKPKDIDKDKEKFETPEGTWTFKGWQYKYKGNVRNWDGKPMEVHDNVEFIGVWHFEPKNTGGGGGGTIVTPPTDPDRIEGNDRIETSVETSKDLYPNGTNAVVLANAERYTDVLTADPFAIQEKASALLTYKYEIPEKTLKEIQRLGAKKIYISGGYEAVSKKVVDSLAAKGYEIFRFDGVDRYDTARKIAIKIREKGNTNAAELASGEDFPDALCMTPLAVKDRAPILLTKKDSIPKYTKQALAEWDIENIKIGGLEKAVSPEVEKQLKSGFEIEKNNKKDSNVYDGAKAVKRIGGEDRYETSAKLAKESYPESKLGVYATGEDFPDALIAGNYAGTKEAPVLLVKGDSLPEPIEKYTKESKIKKATIIGGVNAVSDKVFNLIKAIINR